MAYILDYWEVGLTKDTHYSLKTVRLKSVNEIYPLSLPHNRPNKTNLITVNRTDRQSNIELIVWESNKPGIYNLRGNN
jgi:hypothetical protein